MDFHKETFDGLREQGYEIGPSHIQAGDAPGSGHLYAVVNGVPMLIEVVQDLERRRLTFEQAVALSMVRRP